MEYRKLGNTELDVSLICLGTMTWGEQNNQTEAFEQMDYALEHDVNFFDVAEMYPVPAKPETATRTETIIGNWFEKTNNRDKVILATKIAGRAPFVSHLRDDMRFDKRNIDKAIEGSLRRLKTDYIDLYQLHWPERTTNYFGKLDYEYDPNENTETTSLQETLEVLNIHIDRGNIRHIGLSNETPWGVMKCISLAERLGLPRIVSVQNPYNLFNRSLDVGLSEVCHRERVGVLAYSPLAFGVLSGKYRYNKMPKNSRLDLFEGFRTRYSNSISISALEAYAEIAEEEGVSLTHLALAFVNQRSHMCSNIIGATTMEQLKENINSVHVKLSDEALEKIDRVHLSNPNPCP